MSKLLIRTTEEISALKAHRYENIQESMKGNYGVLLGKDKGYYFCCTKCGKHTPKNQALYSMNHHQWKDGKGLVICYECQQLMKAGKEVPNFPEHKLQLVVSYKNCHKCNSQLTYGQMAASMEVTSTDKAVNGEILCKKCLMTKYGTHNVKPTNIISNLTEKILDTINQSIMSTEELAEVETMIEETLDIFKAKEQVLEEEETQETIIDDLHEELDPGYDAFIDRRIYERYQKSFMEFIWFKEDKEEV